MTSLDAASQSYTQLSSTLAFIRSVKATLKRLNRTLSSASKGVATSFKPLLRSNDTTQQTLHSVLETALQRNAEDLQSQAERVKVAYLGLKECAGQLKQAKGMTEECVEFVRNLSGEGSKGVLGCWRGKGEGSQSKAEIEGVSQLVKGRIQANSLLLEQCIETAALAIRQQACSGAEAAAATPHFGTPPRGFVQRPALYNSQHSASPSEASGSSLSYHRVQRVLGLP